MAIERVDLFPPPHQFTVEEYFAFEERSEFKHEFIDGVIYDWGDIDPDAPVHPDYKPGYPMPHLFTVEEYLAFEAASEFKHEFIDGIIYDMTGGTFLHSKIKVSIIRALLAGLDDAKFEILDSDMSVRVGASRFVYPDLSVVRGEPQLEDDDTVLLNPVAVFEVLSPTSVAYDRYIKLEYYRGMPSLEAYVIVDQQACHAERYTRSESGWHWQAFSDIDDALPLPMLGCALPLAEIYRGIEFTED